MKREKTLILLSLVLVLVSGILVSLWAQSEATPQTPEQVAYVKLTEGDVGYLRGDDNKSEWNAASANVPVMTGDSLYANESSKAEVQLGDNSFLRLGDGAYISVLQNTAELFQLKLTSGTATLRLQELDRGYEIDTPSMAFTPRHPGEYRVDVSANGDAEVTVHQGEGLLSMAEGREELVSAPSRLKVLSTSSLQRDEYASDGWDQWSRERDRAVFHPRPQYMPPGVYGYDTLDAYGTWMNYPAYGWVWSPRVASAWQPYREGRWVWIDPYGWTWVSYEPWGWAPYHYGRWAYADGMGWMWVPGPSAARQIYAPGLVAFVGGDTWMGWMPLGPGEVYQPMYVREVVYVNPQPVVRYVNYQYVTVINRTEIYNTTRIYNYRRIDRRIIERTKVVTTCDMRPRREALYVPGQRPVGARGVAETRHWTPPASLTKSPVYAKNTNLPQVRTFDQKLAEIHKLGTVRPVNPITTSAETKTAGPVRPAALIKPVGTIRSPVAERGTPSSTAQQKPVPASDVKRLPVTEQPPPAKSTAATQPSSPGGPKTFTVHPQPVAVERGETQPKTPGVSAATPSSGSSPKVFQVPFQRPNATPATQKPAIVGGERGLETRSGTSGAPTTAPAQQASQHPAYQPATQVQRPVYTPPKAASTAPSQAPGTYQPPRPQGQNPVYQPPAVNRPTSPQGGYQPPATQPGQQPRTQTPAYQQPRQASPSQAQQTRPQQQVQQQRQQQAPQQQQQQQKKKQQDDKPKPN